MAGIGLVLTLLNLVTNDRLQTFGIGIIVLIIGFLGFVAIGISYTGTFHYGCEEAGGIVIDTSCVDSSVVGTFEYGDLVQIEVKN
jgi:hypothetical protein